MPARTGGVLIEGTFAEREEQVNELARQEVPNVKAEPAGMFGRTPAWIGKFFLNSEWLIARNEAGNPILYASESAALAGAKLRLSEVAHFEYHDRVKA